MLGAKRASELSIVLLLDQNSFIVYDPTNKRNHFFYFSTLLLGNYNRNKLFESTY